MMDAHTSAFDSAHGPFVWVDVNRIRQTYVCDGFLNDNDGTNAKGLSVTYDCNEVVPALLEPVITFIRPLPILPGSLCTYDSLGWSM